MKKVFPAPASSLGLGRYDDGVRPPNLRAGPAECRRKFLRFFPRGFADPKYLEWERNYKWQAHQQWIAALDRVEFARLLRAGNFSEIALQAVRIESRTNLLFSFEKMALRDAVKSQAGARAFAEGLFALLHGRGEVTRRFARWCDVVAALPRRQTRVLTWPLATVFGFIAQPETQLFLKPNVTRRAAAMYGYDFVYASRPTAEVISGTSNSRSASGRISPISTRATGSISNPSSG